MGTSNIARHRHTGDDLRVRGGMLPAVAVRQGSDVISIYSLVPLPAHQAAPSSGWHGVYRAIRAANQTHLR